MKTTDDLVAAVERQGLSKPEATKAVQAVLEAARQSRTATLVFRKVDDQSVSPEQRRTIFLCG